MGLIVSQLLAFLARGALAKFLFMSVLAALVLLLWPLIKELVSPFVNFAAINSSLGGLPAGVWYFMSWARVDLGLPLCVGAMVTRFMVRRIPVVG